MTWPGWDMVFSLRTWKKRRNRGAGKRFDCVVSPGGATQSAWMQDRKKKSAALRLRSFFCCCPARARTWTLRNQNPTCCQLHHGTMLAGTCKIKKKTATANDLSSGGYDFMLQEAEERSRGPDCPGTDTSAGTFLPVRLRAQNKLFFTHGPVFSGQLPPSHIPVIVNMPLQNVFQALFHIDYGAYGNP